MELPNYPRFRPLELSDKPLFDALFRADPPDISEFTFTNLYAWRQAYGFRVSLLDGFVLLNVQKDSEKTFFCPIRKDGTDLKPLIEKLCLTAGATFKRMPEKAALLFKDNPAYECIEDRDNFDYLYEVRDLAELRGRHYHGKRNFITRFNAEHKYRYFQVDEGNVEKCLKFIDVWCDIKDCEGQKSLRQEKAAFQLMLGMLAHSHFLSGAIELDEKIQAVAIGEELNPGTLVIHILKAHPEIPGLYQTINNEFIKQAKDYRVVNMEQDLGIEGLRKAKLSYRPSGYVKKFTISKAAGS